MFARNSSFITRQQAEDLAKEIGALCYVETSAMRGQVQDPFKVVLAEGVLGKKRMDKGTSTTCQVQ